MKEDIKLGVRDPISYKVVIGGMVNNCLIKAPVFTKFLKDVHTLCIVRINIGITSQEDQGIRILVKKLFHDKIKISNLMYEFSVFSGCGKVKSEKESRNLTGRGEDKWKNA